MPQNVCEGCGRLGPRGDERFLTTPEAQPHADGSSCACRHVTTPNRATARRDGGRWFDARRMQWVCEGGCPKPVDRGAVSESTDPNRW